MKSANVTVPAVAAIPAVETPAEKRARKQAERDAQVALEAERKEAERACRRVVMPSVLFNMMVKGQKLANVGLNVSVCMIPALSKSDASQYSAYGAEGEAAIMVSFGDRTLREDDYGHIVVLHMVSESWEVTSLERKLEELQAEADAKAERRKMAEEAKKLLTPEQLAALREFN